MDEIRTCQDCGAEFPESEGFCGDDLVLCRTCADADAENDPPHEAAGRSF